MANDPSRNPIHANLPAYTEPQVQTKARETVADLTGVREKFVKYVDDKVTHSDAGRVSLRGEFESMSAIYKATPDFCPMPIATGDYASDPNVHFFLCSFVDMTDEIAELETLPAKLADLHTKGTSPNGNYGFHVPTNQGALAMPNTWRSSWELFFSEMMQRLFEWEEEMHGSVEEMSNLARAVIEKVIPRLLRPLETGGREIQPCLVHGDLWDGNTSTDAATGKPVVFDASSAYVHNEYELGAWNLPRHHIYEAYINAYQSHFSISKPEEDVGDRLILYRLRFNLTSSGSYLNNLRFRELPSDHIGRRPTFLFTFTLYALASLDLSLTVAASSRPSYTALLVFRALQSLGASAVLSVGYGVVADISVPAERGKVLGPLLATGNIGTCVGPIMGGLIARESRGSVLWVFGGLTIFGGLMLLVLILFLPETARNVVGNGGIRDARWWMRPFWEVLPGKLRRKDQRSCGMSREKPKRVFKFTSPLAALRIIFYQDTALILWISSSYYALWYCIQASIPAIYKSPAYGFDELQVGLAYLPGSIGVIVSMYLAGKAIDYNYKHIAKINSLPIEKVKGDDLTRFPVEKARSRGCGWLLVLSFGVMAGYGWSVQRHIHVAVPLILQFFQGFLSTWVIQCYSTLLIDGFPKIPSTASTTGNMMRCALSAALVAALDPLITAMGRGWFFSLLGCLSGGVGLTAQILLRKRGMTWRNLRTQKPDLSVVEHSLSSRRRSTGDSLSEKRFEATGIDPPDGSPIHNGKGT
ncbi:MAG: hypothetical protein Q9227_006202 [Pyrenula ochraceoflavens]